MQNSSHFRFIHQSLIFICVLAVLGINFAAANAQTATQKKKPNSDPEAAQIVTSDIPLFWKAYDRARPENDLIVYRDEYLKKGSVGLQDFVKARIGGPCGLLAVIEAAPKYYAALREPSLKIAFYEPQIRASFRRLKEIYPDAIFPDVYFVIGRMTSAGTVSENGLLIGVDMFGRNPGAPLDELGLWHKAVVKSTDALPYIVAHEIIHTQQMNSFILSGADISKIKGANTLLAQSIGEGSADFIGELISGKNVSQQLHDYANPREREIWVEFQKEMNGDKTDNWLYQGDKAKGRPADLGYYVGYKIVESYYKNAKDKKQAVKDILGIKDVQEFLKASRYEEKFVGTIGKS